MAQNKNQKEVELRIYKDLDVLRTSTVKDSVYFVYSSATQKVTQIWVTTNQNIPRQVELSASNAITSPDGSIDIVETSSATQIKVDSTLQSLINSALQPGDVIQYTDEQAQDAVGNILTDTSTIDFTYDDTGNTITADVKPNSITATQLANNINTSEFINNGEDGSSPYTTFTDTFTISTNGLVPAPLTLGNKLLQDDGTWVTPTEVVAGGQIANFVWNYKTITTAGDPGTGAFRANSITPSSITQLYIDDLTATSKVDISSLFSAVVGNWSIFVQQKNDADRWVQFTTSTAYTDNSGWWTIPVTYIESGIGGGINNNTDCLFTFINKNYTAIDAIPIDGSNNAVSSNGVYDALFLKEDKANKGISNGYASLDAGGKIPVTQLPSSVMEYKGVYNAATNTPILTNGIGDTGDVYKTSVAGAGVNGLNFVVGDYAIYNGTTWEKSHSGADNVTSVFGRLGDIVAQNGDYTTALVTETTNKNYQTDNQKLFNDATSSIQIQLNSKESLLNKITAISGTSPVAYTSEKAVVDYIDSRLPTNYSKVVYVNSTSPTTATIFDLANPPVTNDDLLKLDVQNIYVATDLSAWVYNSVSLAYETKLMPYLTTNTPQTVSGVKTFLNGMFGLRNVANTFTSFFTNTTTASRTWTLPDKNGTVAMTSDITSVINPGTTNRLPKYVGSTVVGNSRVSDDGTYLGIDSVSPIPLSKDVQLGRQSNKEIGIEQSDSSTNGRDLVVSAGRTINFSESSNFLPLFQTNRIWTGIAGHPNGDVYAVGDSAVWKQTNGSGDFISIGIPVRNYYGIAINSSGDIYVTVNGGDIYKQTASAGSFNALGQTARAWTGICITPSGNVYAVANNDLYKQTGGSGNFIPLGITPRNYTGIASTPTNDLYLVGYTEDIYKQTAETGSFVAQGASTGIGWTCVVYYNGDIYASGGGNGWGADIYKQTALTGAFVAQGVGFTSRTAMGIQNNGNFYYTVYNGDIYKKITYVVGFPDLNGGATRIKAGTGKGTGQSRVQIITGQKTVSGTDMQVEQVVAEFDENGDSTFKGKIIKSSSPTTNILLAGGGDIPQSTFVSSTRTININGVTQDLSTNRQWRAGLSNTGVLTYTGISVSTTTTVNIGAVTGVITDNETSPGTPSYNLVNYVGATNITVPTIAGGTGTYVLLAIGTITGGIGAGQLVFQNTFPTSAQRKSMIYLAKISHPNLSTISFTIDEPDFVTSPLQQFRDLFQVIQYMNQGITVSGNAGLTINSTNGIILGDGINFVSDKANPNMLSVTAGAPRNFLLLNQSGAVGSFTTIIDPTTWDNVGTTTTIGGSTNNSTIQYLYYAPGVGFAILRGQTIYANLTDAVAAVGRESFTLRPNLVNNSILIAAICLRHTTTNMNDISFCRILPADKFGQIGGASSGIAVSTLQTAYNNGLTPQITTTPTLGAVTIKNGGTLDTDNVFTVQNLAGATTASIDGSGLITSTQFKLSALNTAPTSSTDTGTTGEIRIVNGFIYICVAINTWQRTALTTF